MKTQIFVILLVSMIGVTSAVNCYRCVYWDGYKGSVDDCQNENPGYKYAETCAVQTNNVTSYCHKIETKIDEKKIIYRDCYYPDTEADIADQCRKLTVPKQLPGFGAIPKGVLECFCTKDKCNGASNVGVSFSILAFATLVKLFWMF